MIDRFQEQYGIASSIHISCLIHFDDLSSQESRLIWL